MNTISNDEFARQVMLLAHPTEAFRPIAMYDKDGDCIEFLASPEPFYAERIDDLVTVYYSQETQQLVGSLLKNVSQFCHEMARQFPGFMIEIHNGDTKLEHLFRAKLWTTQADPDSVATLVYKKLIYVAEQADARVAEFCPSPS